MTRVDADAANPDPTGSGPGATSPKKGGPPVLVAPLAVTEQEELAAYLAGGPDEVLDPSGQPSTDPARAWRRRMSGWWDDSPWFSADSMTRGFTLRADGRLVGFFGLVALGLQIGGKASVAYGSTTWRVDPAFRHASLSGIAKVLGVTKGSLLFISTQTPALAKILEALKFVHLPRAASFYARQPNTLPIAVSWLAQSPSQEVLLRGASVVSRLYPRIVAAGLAFASRGLAVREVRSADDLDATAVDALWTRTRGQNGTTNLRTAAYVAWQCFGTAQTKKLFACWFDRELVGFAIVGQQTARDGHLHIDQVMDLWIDAAVPRAADALVGAIIQSALQTSADLVELPTFSARTRAAARRGGFLPRVLLDRGEWVLGPKEALASLASDDAYLCLLQGDAGL